MVSLKVLLEQSQAVVLEKERQQVETYVKKLEELEVTCAVKLECELNKWWESKVLQQSFDKERQLWYRDKEEWTICKASAQGEKNELLLHIAEFKRGRPTVSKGGSGGEHSSFRGSEKDGRSVPGFRGWWRRGSI